MKIPALLPSCVLIIIVHWLVNNKIYAQHKSLPRKRLTYLLSRGKIKPLHVLLVWKLRCLTFYFAHFCVFSRGSYPVWDSKVCEFYLLFSAFNFSFCHLLIIAHQTAYYSFSISAGACHVCVSLSVSVWKRGWELTAVAVITSGQNLLAFIHISNAQRTHSSCMGVYVCVCVRSEAFLLALNEFKDCIMTVCVSVCVGLCCQWVLC